MIPAELTSSTGEYFIFFKPCLSLSTTQAGSSRASFLVYTVTHHIQFFNNYICHRIEKPRLFIKPMCILKMRLPHPFEVRFFIGVFFIGV